MRTQLGFFGIAGVLFVISSCSSGGTNNNTSNGSGGKTGSGGSSSAQGGSGIMCPTDRTACNNLCVDIKIDNLHCGGCGKTCATGQSCSNGACQCTGGLTSCNNSCVNLQSDGNNCGTCGTVCSNGQACSQGKCGTCASNETKCDNSCSNTNTDSSNCGFCGNKCSGGQSCSNGACSCPTGQATCNGACTDINTSTANCGSCGKACGSGQSCSNGTCVGGTGSGGSGGGTSAGGSTSGGSSQGGGSNNTGGKAATGGGGGTTSTGGGTSTGGSGGGSTSACAKAGIIANFEEGAGTPQVIKQEGRSGEFEIFNDATSTSETMTVESSGGTAECDKFALHVKGSGYTSWGAGVGFSLVGTTKMPSVYNATTNNFTGIRFKAKLGSTSDTSSPVRFNISTPFTESKDNTGGQCTPFAGSTTKAKIDCYQHAGRFLPAGSATGALNTSWQTFTYCFDRDLYPLSLPSNMTNDQRNNVGASMLKVQFQFNKGKNYSGSYVKDWPVYSPGLPFDFWLDDVTFTTGDCPNTFTSPSNNSPAKPFPQNTKIGSCDPATNAPKFAAAIAQAYATWQKNFVQNDHVNAPEQPQYPVTSESLGYGMMIAAAMGDKTLFDKFHSYVKGQGGSGTGLMKWASGQNGSASDADLDIAFALLMANMQWPSGNYLTPANDMAKAIGMLDLVNSVVTGGSDFHQANYNPSYFAPAVMRKFSTLSGAISTNFSLVNGNINAPVAGIPTDWASKTDGKPSNAGGANVTSEVIDGDLGAMGYDAARVPWRLGLDSCLGGSESSAPLKTIINYFAAIYDQGASIDQMRAGWYKASKGSGADAQVHPAGKNVSAQGSYIGPMGAGAMASGNTVMRDRAFRTILDTLESGDFNHTYFPSTVGLLTLLMMSGNFPTPP